MTITKEGSLVSFYTVNKAPIKHLRVYFSSKQSGSGDPSPENVRPIEGWNNIQFAHSGKSLFPFKKTLIGPLSSWLNGTNMWWVKNELVDIFLKGRTVTFSAEFDTTGVTDNNNRCGVKLWSRNQDGTWGILGREGTYITKETIGRSKITQTYTNYKENEFGATLPAGAIVSKPMVELGSTMTEYEPYKGSMQTIDWSNDIGTIYGGYVDLITGELVATHNMITYNTSNMDNNEDYPGWRNQIDIMLSYFPSGIASRTNATLNVGNRLGYNTRTYGTLFLPVEDYELNQTEWIAKAQDIQIILPYITPITYQLNPQQLQTFIGKNNIWSNADRVEVEYDLAESNDELYRRRNIILQGAPHLENASGNIANFNTDLAAPIKDAKIYFNPVQEGSGDPSLENVRNISGWTGVQVTKTGKNMLNPSTYKNTSPYTSHDVIFVHDGNGTVSVSGTNSASSEVRVGFMWVQPFTCNYYVCSNLDVTSTYADVYIWDVTTSARVKQWDGETASLSSAKNRPIVQVQLPAGHQIRITCRVFPGKNVDGVSYKPMLLAANCTDTTFETYVGSSTNISWTSSGTIYGGYVDLINNEIVETWHSITADGINIKANSQYIRNNTKIGGGIVYVSPYGNHQSDSLFNTTVLCNKLPTVSQQGQNLTEPYLWCARNGMLFVVFYLWNASDFETTPTKQETINATNAWLQENPVTIVYKLNTPIHHPLTPQTLKTFKGINNIWSNTNGNTEIKYWTH